MQHSVLLVDALPGLDHLWKEGFDYIVVPRLEDVVLWPRAEDFKGSPKTPTHLLFTQEFNFSTKAVLGPGRHAVVDWVRGALLQTVHSDWFSWTHTSTKDKVRDYY